MKQLSYNFFMIKKLFLLCLLILLFSFCKKEEELWPWPEPPAPVIADYPCWTPDGSKIAYCRDQQIWIVDTLGNTWNMFEGSSFGAVLPHFSPDGKWLVFVSRGHIYKARVREDWRIDTSSITKLTDFARNFFPKWSPNGDLIAYNSNAHDTSNLLYSIWLMKVDGSEKRMIPNGDGMMPSWSPSGKRIVYDAGGGQIVIISIDGSQRKLLTIGEGPASWAPFDTLIAFRKDSLVGKRGKPFIYLIDTSGARFIRLTSGMQPTWSPDGKKIAFCDLCSEGERYTEYWTLYIIDIESKKRKQLIFK